MAREQEDIWERVSGCLVLQNKTSECKFLLEKLRWNEKCLLNQIHSHIVHIFYKTFLCITIINIFLAASYTMDKQKYIHINVCTIINRQICEWMNKLFLRFEDYQHDFKCFLYQNTWKWHLILQYTFKGPYMFFLNKKKKNNNGWKFRVSIHFVCQM